MMNEKDAKDAANAMLGWLESQELEPVDAVPVVLLVLAGLIHEVAKHSDLDRMEGGRAAGEALLAALRLAP